MRPPPDTLLPRWRRPATVQCLAGRRPAAAAWSGPIQRMLEAAGRRRDGAARPGGPRDQPEVREISPAAADQARSARRQLTRRIRLSGAGATQQDGEDYG